MAQTVGVTAIPYLQGTSSYAELHIYIPGVAVADSMLADSNYRQAVELLIMFSQKGEIVNYDKITLNHDSPERDADYFDIKRYMLPAGDYDLELSWTDLHDPSHGQTIIDKLSLLDGSSSKPTMSRPALLQNVTQGSDALSAKNGMLMELLPYDVIHPEMSHLIAYSEIYNLSDTTQTYFIEYGILADASDKVITRSYKRLGNTSSESVLLTMDLKDISAGDHNFFVTLKDQDKLALHHMEQSFSVMSRQADNGNNVDLMETFAGRLDTLELWYSLKSIMPLLPNKCHPTLQEMIDQEEDKSARVFLYSFWSGVNAKQPDTAYQAYYKMCTDLDKVYGVGALKGYETDRGYIYLKYGSPTDIFPMSEEPSAPPYEIWVYNQFPETGQIGVKFLFYNPSLDERSFLLLHSNAINERNNPNWQKQLYSLVPTEFEGSNYHDPRQVSEGVYRMAVKMFEDL